MRARTETFRDVNIRMETNRRKIAKGALAIFLPVFAATIAVTMVILLYASRNNGLMVAILINALFSAFLYLGSWRVAKGVYFRGQAETALCSAYRRLEERTKELSRGEENLRITLNSIGDAVIAADAEGRVTRMNPVAGKITGWKMEKARGEALAEVFHIVDARTREPAVNPVARALESGETVGLANRVALISGDDREYRIAGSAAPIRDDDGKIVGAALVFRDETEARRAREEPRRSEERYHRAFESSRAGKALVRPDGRFYEVNEAMRKMLGYTEKELLSMTVADITHPDDVTESRNAMKKLLRGEMANDMFALEKRYNRKDGSLVRAWITVALIRNRRGRPTCLSAEIENITKRKRAEEALKIFRSAVEASTDAVGMATPDGGHYYQNKAFDHMFGDIGEDPPAIYADRSVGREVFRTIMAGKTWIGETGMRGADDRPLDIFLRAYAVKDEDGRITNLVGVHTDITKRKQQEAELRRLRNYLSNIIDSMPSALIGVDVDGRVTQWNRTSEQATGISPGAARGKILSDVFPRMASEMEKIAESIRSREIKQARRRPRLSENGATRYEDVTIYPLIANGVEGAVIRVDDVTAQARVEETLAQSEKMLSVGGLAAGMAHEINNPLAGMTQNAFVINSRLTNPDMPANRRAAKAAGASMESILAFMEARGIIGMLENIRESGARASGIVTNMLSFARKSDSKYTPHALSELVDQTANLAGSDYDLKKKYDFRRIEIIREYEKDLPDAPCEAGKIQQVLLNILRNGAEAMIAHGVARGKRAVESKPPRFILRLSHEKEAGRARVEIEDNGPGMDEATRKRVFEPFFTTKPTDLGTGLGLSVSYFIITKDHGGEMSVESTPGEGTKFIIRLPLERLAN